MFSFYKPDSLPPYHPPNIRDTLFGDLPLEAWPSPQSPPFKPWSTFAHAREALAVRRTAEAIADWRRIIEMPNLESRHYLQAWHFLRAHNIQPPAGKAKQLLGVVIEVPMENGLDLLAAYPEFTARYYNYSGAAIIWEHPNTSLDKFINALLQAGKNILPTIGPSEKPRPPAPPPDHLRINLLTPSGLHFGQGPFNALAADPLAEPAIDAATELMKQLVSLRK